MIEEYKTIDEVAEQWGISSRRVRLLCSTDRIDGAVKFGSSWAIPINAKRPQDKRVTTGQYRNWRKNSSDTEKA